MAQLKDKSELDLLRLAKENEFRDCKKYDNVTHLIEQCRITELEICPGESDSTDTKKKSSISPMAQIAPFRTGAVTHSALLADAQWSWLHTNGNLAGHRYSVLTQLNPSNAADLNVAWIFAPGGETDAQNTPLYHDGIVYFAQDNKVFAIDARSGSRIWKYEHELPETFGGYNVDFITGKHRGLAIYSDYIYFLSNDAKLHAIHYKTGEAKFVKQYLTYPEDFDKAEDGDSTGYATTVGPMAIPGGQIIVPPQRHRLRRPAGLGLWRQPRRRRNPVGMQHDSRPRRARP